MKKKLLGLLIVLALIVVMIPILTSADSEPASVKFIIGGATPEITRGGEPVYLVTNNETGAVSASGANENNYNVKIVYENDKTPVIYLKGAFIYGAYGSIRNTSSATVDANDTVPSAKRASKTTIVVEEAGESITTSAGTVAADSCLDGVITWASGALEIQGPGKLVANKTISAGSANDLTFTNADVEINAVDGSAGLGAKNITFNGGKFVSNTTNKSTISDWGSTERKIWIKNNADVTMNASAESPLVLANANATVQIDSGSLKLKSASSDNSEHVALRMSPDADFIVNGGIVELSGAGRILYSNRTFDMTNYGAYYAACGANANGPGTTVLTGGTTITKNADYTTRYLKIEPTYTITTTGCTASVATATVGTNVTLTLDTVAGKVFDSWTSTDIDVNSITENEGVYSFTMPAKNVAITANFAYKTTVKILGTEYTFTDSDTVYLKTESGALVAATDADYNVKLAYDTNKVPTIYLKNADLSDDESVIDTLTTSELAIVTEAASTLFYTNDIVVINTQTTSSKYGQLDPDFTGSNDMAGAIKTAGKITFSGNALLTLKGNGSAIYGTSGTNSELVFNNANVSISKLNASGKSGGWYDNTFGGDFKAITFNGGTATLSTTRFIILASKTIKIDNGAKVTVNANGFTYNTPTIDVQNGSFYMEGNTTGVLLNGTNINVGANGTFEIKNTSTGANAAIGTKTPTLDSGLYAVMGASKADAAAYAVADGALTGEYFKAGKAYTVTATNGTAQSVGAAAATTKAFVGDEVALSATAPDGQILTNWEVTAGTAIINGNTLIMPAGDVTVKANFGYGASITIGNYDYTVVKGGAAMYFKTDANGAVTVAGDENDYNLKFVYADETEAVPTLSLRNAYVASAIKSNTATLAKTAIVVEDTASGKVTTAEGEISADAYVTGAITWTHGDLEIQGPGKVMITKTITTTGKALTFKNADVELKTGTAVGLSGQNITFNGGKFVFEATHALISDWTETNPNVYTILVTNDANVSVTSENSALVLPYATSASTLTVDSGYLKLASISDADTDGYGKTLRIKDTAIKINGGIVEFAGSKSLIYGCTPVLNLTEYTNYCASYSSSVNGTNLKAFESDTITAYYQNAYAINYIKIGPAYTITVNGATASHAKASAGDVITLTPERRVGYKLDSWTIDDGSTDYTIADNKFTMPAHDVSITANYVADPNADAEPDEVIFKFASTKVTVVRGETYYFITKADGTITAENATADNYNIKIEYERVKDKTPVIYLRGAYIKGSYGSIYNNDYSTLCTDNERASKVTIIVEKELGNATSAVPSTVTADSYLVSYIFLSKGDVEIQGPGKLVVDKAVSGDTIIRGGIQAGGDLIFTNADVQLLNGALKGKDITFDGGKIDVTVTGEVAISIWQNPYVVLVKNNAEVKIASTDKAAAHIVGTDAALQIDSGSLVLKSTAEGTDSEKAALKIGSGGKLIMNGGTLEISGTITVVTGTINMELNGNFDAVCANNADGNNTVAYNLLPELRQYNTSWQLKYFKIQPGTGSGNGGSASGGNTSSHTHSTTKVSGKAASCTADGVKEHYKCSCGKFFEDKNAKKEIKDINTWKVIKATGHKDANKDGKCDTCKAAQTSDSSFNALWITLLTVSTLGLCVTFVYNKKMRATK